MDVSSGGGTVKLDDKILEEYPYTETYAKETTVTLTAEPEDGYEFDHYEIKGALNSNPSVQLYINCVMSVDARFTSATPHSNDDDGGGGCFVNTAAH